MKTIINKTRKPLRISLPRGKKLHLGPGGTAAVQPEALERPALKKLVDAGDIEVTDEGKHSTGASARGAGQIKGTSPGFGSGANDSGRRGDR